MFSSLQKIRLAQKSVPKWDQYPATHFEVRELPGGLTNLLSTVHLLHCPPQQQQHQHNRLENVVLFREFGAGSDALIHREQEARIIQTLSSLGLHPQVYASYEWGRIQRFLSTARALTAKEYRSEKFAPLVGELLGQLHAKSALLQPACRGGTSSSVLPTRLESWLKKSLDSDSNRWRSSQQAKLAALQLPTLISELEWIVRDLIPRLNSPLVVVHSDFQAGNVLIENETNELLMIDMEYGGQMERGFDLGNCFCEMGLDYGIENFPGFVLNPDLERCEKIQDIFLLGYCKGAQLSPQAETLALLKQEANAFRLVSHFHWALWSVVMSASSTISFGYLEYALQRLDQYWVGKKAIKK